MRAQQPGKGQAKKQRAQTLFQQGQIKQARTLYEKLCRENPRDAECHYMLGSIAGQQRKFDTAATHFRKTIELQPDALVAHCGLGAALKGMGRYAEAEAAFRAALHLQPGSIDIQLELASALLHQDKIAEAQETLQEVLDKAPDSAAALHGLGEIHHLHRDIEQAKKFYQAALHADPKRADTHNRLGFALHAQGFLEDAIVHFRKAIALQATLIDPYKNLASSLLTAGRLDEAQTIIDKALRLFPGEQDLIVSAAAILERHDNPAAAYEKLAPLLKTGIQHAGAGIVLAGMCRKLNRCDEAATYLEELLRNPGITDATREKIHYALGQLYDHLARYDDAFPHFKGANDLCPDRFSAAEHIAMISALIDTFSQGFLADAPRATVDTGRPVFIVGMPRAGTSLTEQILARHTEVFAAGELPDIGGHCARLTRILAPPGFPNGFRKLTRDQLNETAQAYLDRLAHLDGTTRLVTDKMPQNFLYLGLIALLFPQAHVVHCVRDPRDTCLSIYFQRFNESHDYATDLRNLGTYYRAYERLMAHWKTVLDIPIMDLHYEDMVQGQEETTRRLLDFLGLAWDPDCLDFHTAGRFVATASYDQIRQPIYNKSVARWRHYEKYITPLLEALG